ncbi:MAG: cation:proton antiporter [Planctomycetaceae bacterium]|jgi:CPA2 family monovalent cation:H+ antiporter-2|nr:cation:proton antiporter [Planctomycetaceae bacterium]
MELPALIRDLGLILMAAAVMTLLFKWLKQPIVLGYLIAGFLVGPHFQFLPAVNDTHSVKTWSEIGVIFMLFGLGLEFSFRKLIHVGKTATITATFEILCMIIAGYAVGRILGWSTMSSLFLGAILSMSSTTIIVKAFSEQNLKGVNFASIVFGVLIVEDLIAILLLVLLGSIAVTQNLSGAALIGSSLKLVFFLILWFILGIFLLPVFFRFCRKLFTDEILLIVSMALCFMMVIIAVRVGFSTALGAFVMGSLLAETAKGSKIEELIVPVKDLFSAIFFVSVGMLIDPTILVQYFGIIILLTVITVVGKFFGTSIGALISGCNIKSSMQSGMSMAQIGEFSFIIAMLGTNLKVTNDYLYPVAVAVSAITTFTTPYLIKYSGVLAESLDRKIPDRLKQSLLKYELVMRDTGKHGIVGLIWRVHGIKILLNSVIIVGVTLACRYAAAPFIKTTSLIDESVQLQSGFLNYAMCLAALVLSAPFIWAIFISRRPRSGDYDTETVALLQRLHLGVSIVRLFIGCGLVGFIFSNFLPVYAVSGLILIPFVVLLLVLFSRYFEPVYHKFETQFITHLTEKEKEEIASKAKLSNLAPWNVTLTEFKLSQNSSLVAKSLKEARLRNRFGVIVAMIERGNVRFIPPKGEDLLLPFDKIFMLGTDSQLAAARDEIEKDQANDLEVTGVEEIGLMPILLEAEHPFVGLMVLECGIRELAGGLIVGIERGATRQLNPMPEMVLQANDLLWIVGNKDSIKQLQNRKFEFVSGTNIYQNTMVDYSGY